MASNNFAKPPDRLMSKTVLIEDKIGRTLSENGRITK